MLASYQSSHLNEYLFIIDPCKNIALPLSQDTEGSTTALENHVR
jgi:hypothetical protein